MTHTATHTVPQTNHETELLMAILKLAIGRENAISGEVANIEVDESGRYGEQYKIEFTTGDLMWLPKDGADRQFKRMDKLPNEIIGEEITFWKKPQPQDPTRGYLNIEMGANGTPVGTVFSQGNGAAPSKKPELTFDELKERYVECLAAAHSLIDEYNVAMEEALPPETKKDVATTLFIERNKRGV